MAFTTENILAGNGSTDVFPFTFPYIKRSDVKVSVENADGDAELKTLNTHYEFANDTQIRFINSNTPALNRVVRIFRDTDIDNAFATHFPGSSIRADDLNNNNLQTIYSDQERQTYTVDKTGGTFDGDVNFDNDVVIGADSTKDLTINARVDSDIIPKTNDARDLGSTSNRWAQVWTEDLTADDIQIGVTAANEIDTSAGGLTIDSAGGTVTVDDNLSVTGTSTLTGNITAAGDIDVDGVANLDNVDIDGTIHAASTSTFVGAITASGGVVGNVTGDLTGNASTATDLAAATKITDTEAKANGFASSDSTYFTSLACDERYFNISTGDTIKDGDAFPDNDTSIATTAAINDRIIDLVDDVGGFVPIANETSFPAANPDVNNGAGTIVSVAVIGTTRTPTNGTVTIANGSGSNTVTINNCGTTVLTSGFGVLVETTNTLHTYNFHRLTPKATEVTAVAGNQANITTVATNIADVNTVATNIVNVGKVATIDGNVTTVAGIDANVTTVAGIQANVSTVAGISADVTTVAGRDAEIQRLGTADAVADMNTLATADIVADMNTLATAANVTAMDNCSDDIANINTVATNIADVNNFADVYQINNGDPTQRADGTSLQEGDLVYRSDTDVVRVYNGSSYSDITPNQATINDITIVADDLASFEDLGSIADALVANQTGGALETCADNISDIQAVENIAANVTTVAGISANVTTVAGVSANVTTVANSIGDVNRYANEYFIGTQQPQNPSAGDLWYDSNNNQNTLKFYDGSSWNAISAGISNIVSDTNPALGGHLDCNNKNLTEVGTVSGDDMAMDFGAVTDT